MLADRAGFYPSNLYTVHGAVCTALQLLALTSPGFPILTLRVLARVERRMMPMIDPMACVYRIVEGFPALYSLTSSTAGSDCGVGSKMPHQVMAPSTQFAFVQSVLLILHLLSAPRQRSDSTHIVHCPLQPQNYTRHRIRET